jgi:hypothetical protein
MPAARLEGHEGWIAAAVLRARDEIQLAVTGEAPASPAES